MKIHSFIYLYIFCIQKPGGIFGFSMILEVSHYDLVDSHCNLVDPGVAPNDPNVSGMYINIIYDPHDHVSTVLTLPKKFGRSSALALQFPEELRGVLGHL